MKTYDVSVAVMVDASGRSLHDVAKQSVSELELALLRRLHGVDRVTIKAPGPDIERSERNEHLMLARKYGDGGTYGNNGPALVAKVFGVDLFEFDNWLAEQLELEEEARQQSLETRQIRFNAEMATRPIGSVTTVTAAPAPEREGSSFEIAKAAMAGKSKAQPAVQLE